MGRPATHSPEDFLAAAVALFGQGGARAVTMSAVASQAGAPSGSVYHRFPSRPALLCSTWRHVARGFEQEYAERLGTDPSVGRAIDAVVWMIDWCRAHPGEASVLHAGRQAFSPEEWSAPDVAAERQERRARDRAMAAIARSLAMRAGCRADEAAFVLFTLPIALVQQHQPGSAPSPVSGLARRLVVRFLGR